MPKHLPNREHTFGLLPEDEGRWGSFGISMVSNLVVMTLVVLLGAAVHKVEKQKYVEHMVFVQQNTPPPPPPPVVPKIKVVAPEPKLPEVVKLDPPKIIVPKIQPPPEIPKPVKLDTPDQPKLPPAPVKAIAPPAQPKVGLFSTPKPADVAKLPVTQEVKTSGFGAAQDAKTSPNALKVATGAFNNAPSAAASPAMGRVATAGFANGVVGGTSKPAGVVSSAGFSNNLGAAPTQVAIKTSEPAFIPPVVISEPHPEYTQEAAQLRIQGEVTLQVRFLATGQVEVLRVVNGLGHGLDEAAKRVAERIRFKPAEKDGHPVDHTTLIHVTFQLA